MDEQKKRKKKKIGDWLIDDTDHPVHEDYVKQEPVKK